MANVKLKKKKESGYEQLYPQTLANNVITSTGNVQADINVLRQRIVSLEFFKTPIIIEAESRYSNGETQIYEVSSYYAWYFQNTDANLKIVFSETNQGKNIVIDVLNDMGMTMQYPILAGFYGYEFKNNEIKAGKIYSLIYKDYQYYLSG